MKPLVLIPARGGSKGLPGKNIKILGQKPLIQYTIEAARTMFPDNLICVSTDDTNIRFIVESMNLSVPFLRPKNLAIDTAGTCDVILHAVMYYQSIGYNPDQLILLQPTSPFRTSNHIINALNLFDESCDMVVSVKETKSNPYYNLLEEDDSGYLRKLSSTIVNRRQDVPKLYEYNGAIYIINLEEFKRLKTINFMRIKKYIMDDISSIDIDTLLDFLLAETVLNNNIYPK